MRLKKHKHVKKYRVKCLDCGFTWAGEEKTDAGQKHQRETKHDVEVTEVIVHTHVPASEYDPEVVDVSFLDKLVRDIRLSSDTVRALSEHETYFVGELLKMSRSDLSRLPMMGKKAYADLREYFWERGFQLGCGYEGWTKPDLTSIGSKPLEFGKLPEVTARLLHALDIKTVGDMTKVEGWDLRKIAGVSITHTSPIDEYLKEEGVVRGMFGRRKLDAETISALSGRYWN